MTFTRSGEMGILIPLALCSRYQRGFGRGCGGGLLTLDSPTVGTTGVDPLSDSDDEPSGMA